MRLGWTITFEDKQYRESDLTLGQALLILEGVGGTWEQLHPLTSPAHLIGILSAFLVAGGEDENEVLARLVGLNMVAALDMISPGE